MSIISSITGLATGGMSTVYKYLAIGGVVLGLAVTAFFYGEHIQASVDSAKQLKQDVKQEQQVITITKVQTVIDTQAVDDLQTKLDAANAKNAGLQKQLADLKSSNLTVITGQGANTTCSLSSDWINLYNGSLQP